jgi:hypothetical protein
MLNEANAQVAALRASLEKCNSDAAMATAQAAEFSRQIAVLQAKSVEQQQAKPIASTPRASGS